MSPFQKLYYTRKTSKDEFDKLRIRSWSKWLSALTQNAWHTFAIQHAVKDEKGREFLQYTNHETCSSLSSDWILSCRTLSIVRSRRKVNLLEALSYFARSDRGSIQDRTHWRLVIQLRIKSQKCYDPTSSMLHLLQCNHVSRRTSETSISSTLLNYYQWCTHFHKLQRMLCEKVTIWAKTQAGRIAASNICSRLLMVPRSVNWR